MPLVPLVGGVEDWLPEGLINSVQDKDLQAALRAIKADGSKINDLFSSHTALYMAAKHKEEKVLNALLAAEADPDVACDRGERATHAAAREKNISAMQALIAAGADLNHVDTLNKQTPLHLAIEKGDLPMVQLLAEQPGIQLKARTGFGRQTLLEYATFKKDGAPPEPKLKQHFNEIKQILESHGG